MARVVATPAFLAGTAVALANAVSPAASVATMRTMAALNTVKTAAPASVSPATAPVAPTTTLPPPTTTSVPAAPAVDDSAAPATAAAGGVPPQGQATASGCGPALAYLAAYAAPGFDLVCPGYAMGHQAATCINEAPCAPGQKMIVIADACPAAYMNEAHNSWAIQDGGAIDPYGYCAS